MVDLYLAREEYTPMANYLYVDNSNVWIEGKRVSAVKKKLAPDILTARQQNINDPSWSYDFGRLFEFAGGDIGLAKLYGSRPPPNDSVWLLAEKKGFNKPIVFDRSFFGKEKKVDTQITSDAMEDLYTKFKKGDEMTLVAGDADFVPLAEKVRAVGYEFHVVFWDHAAAELKAAATKFISLNPYLDHLAIKRTKAA